MKKILWLSTLMLTIQLICGIKLFDLIGNYATNKSENGKVTNAPSDQGHNNFKLVDLIGNHKTNESENGKVTNAPSDFPTKFPTIMLTNSTQFPTIMPSTSSPPTFEPYFCSLEKEVHQLKMYWRKGMEWQQSKREKAWCAECDDDCDSGERVRIRECDDNEEEQVWVFYNCTVRPARNERVCFTTSDSIDTKEIRLRDCGENDMEDRQKFRLYDPDNIFQKFQVRLLKPGPVDICLSQQHHPRDKETLRFYSCIDAFENDRGVSDDTSHWVLGEFDGH